MRQTFYLALIATGFAWMLGTTAQDGPKKVMEFADVCCEDEKARLDYFAVELQKDPIAQGYIIFYGGRRYPSCWYGGRRYRARRPRYGEAEARAARLKPYLTYQRGLSTERVVVVNGGYRDSWMAELWIVPKGAIPPVPTPTLAKRDVRFRKGKVTKREFQLQCMEG